MNKIVRNVICLIFLMTIIACSNSSPFPKGGMPDLDMSSDQMNNDFQLYAPNRWNNFKIGDEVTLAIRDISKDQITFEPDFGARIFTYENNKWVEVENLLRYDYLSSEAYIVAPFMNNPFNEGAISVLPNITNPSKATIVRIILVGSISREGKSTEKTAAYIDVKLKP